MEDFARISGTVYLIPEDFGILETVCFIPTQWVTCPRNSDGFRFQTLGGLYLVVMIARLVLGLTAMAGDPWFDRPLPTVFHLLLACFLIAVGMFHRRASSV